MDTNSIIQLISNIGFPIACAIAIFIYWQKDREQNLATLDKLRDTIENNTKVMLQLLSEITRRNKDGD